MGRNKQYDRENILRHAMDVFWRYGYEATSTEMLVQAMGINRFSVYAEFGSKQALYVSVLELYYAEMVERNLAIIEAPHAGIDAAASLIQNMVRWGTQPSSELGCLICNAATERAPTDPESRDFVHRYINRLAKGFTKCLVQAQIEQRLKSDIHPEQEGRLLATLFLGLLVQLRARVPFEQIQELGRGAQGYFQRLCNPLAFDISGGVGPAEFF
jgi:TetR/AcrR family transcriptional repressor of nem operon